jgi:molybdopterin-guanine dinucleotide biosynthesis protein A
MMQECKGNLDGIVVNACGRTQPLVAIYNVRLKATLEAFLKENNVRMMEFLAQLEILYVDERALRLEGNIFQNVNKEGDLEYLRK